MRASFLAADAPPPALRRWSPRARLEWVLAAALAVATAANEAYVYAKYLPRCSPRGRRCSGCGRWGARSALSVAPERLVLVADDSTRLLLRPLYRGLAVER